MDYSFRKADIDSETDCASVVLLVSAFELNQTGKPASDPDGLISALRSFPTTHAYICEVRDESDAVQPVRPAGLALCFLGFSSFLRKPLLNIHDFFVLDEFRGQGIGRAFLSFLEDEARRSGWARITLEVYGDNLPARTLYESCGFTGSRQGTDRISYFLQKGIL